MIFDIINQMPKIELHLHLEGAIPYEALWELVKKYDGTNQVKSIDELKQKFQYTDFPHFIETWVWKNRFLCEYEDFTFIAGKVAEDLVSQNIIYAEAFYSPPDFFYKKLDTRKITEAITKGLKPYEDRIKINLVADMVRDFGAERAMKTLYEINEVKDMGVIGIGIGGSEHQFPPEIFKDVYDKARKLGFKTSAHAGEAAGPASIWGALMELKADRIGHGTRAFEDEKLVEYLIENNIPVELCPISNVRTGVVESFEKHPLKQYYDRGMVVFLNTDDPKMFNNTLAEEYLYFIEKMGYTIEDVKVLLNNAINSSWCSEEEKMQLRMKIRE
ncbi:MAG: adenosine deaminase [Ignavibacteriae bacterium]|nr:MAG: adenosine deaminase [Ignavibacteriota bacterium]